VRAERRYGGGGKEYGGKGERGVPYSITQLLPREGVAHSEGNKIFPQLGESYKFKKKEGGGSVKKVGDGGTEGRRGKCKLNLAS